eukprot:1567003-Amphidinium_carterae.1
MGETTTFLTYYGCKRSCCKFQKLKDKCCRPFQHSSVVGFCKEKRFVRTIALGWGGSFQAMAVAIGSAICTEQKFKTSS